MTGRRRGRWAGRDGAGDHHDSARLVIQPFVAEDAGALCRGAEAFGVKSMTLRIPHPYKIEDAYKWLAGLPEGYESGKSFPMAVTRGGELGQVVGAGCWGSAFACGTGLLD